MAARKKSVKAGRGLKSTRTGTARNGAKRALAHAAAKEPGRKNRRGYLKVARATVIVGGSYKPSAYARKAQAVFSAGVQDALKRLAAKGIPAVVVENGRRYEAVPRKVGGRYVVLESDAARSPRGNSHGRSGRKTVRS